MCTFPEGKDCVFGQHLEGSSGDLHFDTPRAYLVHILGKEDFFTGVKFVPPRCVTRRTWPTDLC